MSDAAHEHLQTVNTALSEAQTLTGEVGHLEGALQQAIAQVSHAVTTLTDTIAAIGVQADLVKSTTEQAKNAAESHLSDTLRTGHSTLAHVEAAQQDCEQADAATGQIHQFLETLLGQATEAKSDATRSLGAMLTHIAEGTDGARNIVDRLDEAQTHINATLHT